MFEYIGLVPIYYPVGIVFVWTDTNSSQCWLYGVSFYPLLVSFHLQIAYKMIRNLQIGVE